MALIFALFGFFRSVRSWNDLALENLALRQQLAVFKRRTPRPRLDAADRLFWIGLSRWWPRWQEALCLVKPQTVVSWHRAGVRLFWRWRSRRGGRPRVDAEIRALVQRLARDNATWGAPRIHGELLKLGYRVAQSTVAAYLPSRPKPPSQTWRTFLKIHLFQAAAIDFFVIPTVTFRLLYGFVVLEHGRRRISHIAVTAHPTAAWTSRQLREAFPFDTAPRFLHRDRDSIFAEGVTATIRAMGIEDAPSALRSPWQNPYCERLIGSLRRELLDHVIVLGERHTVRLLREYQAYYNESRPHVSLAKDAPDGRAVESVGSVRSREVLGALHHRYFRCAA
jgi:putative transposase